MSEIIVTQADRKAAFQHAFAIGRANIRHEEAIMAGAWDDTNDVQAFTRHRQQAIEEAARVAESINRDHTVFQDVNSAYGYAEARTDIATAIRQLSGDRP